MNTKRYQLVLKSLIVPLLFVFSGCGAAVIETTHYAYNHIRGDLVGIVPYQIEQVFPVTAAVVKELDGYDLVRQQSDFLNARVTAYDEESRKVQIDLSRTEHNQTKIQIRIGWIGDKIQSSMIFNYIVNQLSKQPPLDNLYSERAKGDHSRHKTVSLSHFESQQYIKKRPANVNPSALSIGERIN